MGNEMETALESGRNEWLLEVVGCCWSGWWVVEELGRDKGEGLSRVGSIEEVLSNTGLASWHLAQKKGSSDLARKSNCDLERLVHFKCTQILQASQHIEFWPSLKHLVHILQDEDTFEVSLAEDISN